MKIKEAIIEPAMSHLLHLCRRELELDELPPITLIHDKPFIQSGDQKSFGEFSNNSIKIITLSRHPMDVMRSLAHELSHWKQHLKNQEMDGSDGSETENQANSLAGIIMRKFAQKYPDYFIDSLPS